MDCETTAFFLAGPLPAGRLRRRAGRAAARRRAEDLRAERRADGEGDGRAAVRKGRARAPPAGFRDEGDDPAADRRGYRERQDRARGRRDGQRAGRLLRRQLRLSRGGRADERGRDAQMHRRGLGQRLRRGDGRASVRQRGGLRRAHEPPRRGAGHGRHPLHELHGSLRGSRALHDRLRHRADVARARAPRARQALYDDLDGHDPRRGLRAEQHQQAGLLVQRLHGAQDRLHLPG